MQDLKTSAGKCWTNAIISHNDRKNDALFYWISFMLYLFTLFSSVVGTVAITFSESHWAILGIPILSIALALSTHWYQCLSVRYWSSNYLPSENGHVNLGENEISIDDL